MTQATYLNQHRKDETVTIANTKLEGCHSAVISAPLDLGLTETQFEDLASFTDAYIKALLFEPVVEEDVQLMTRWLSGVAPCFGKRYGHFHTNDKSYLVIIKRINSELHECLRFFYRGTELTVSVDKSCVDLISCMQWLADESVNATM